MRSTYLLIRKSHNLTVPSSAPVAMIETPFRKLATALTIPACPVSFFVRVPSSTSQTATLLSALQVNSLKEEKE